MQQAESEFYRETIGSIYLFENAYSGGLRASYADERLFGSELLMTGTEGDMEVKQRYECVLLPDGSMWSADLVEDRLGEQERTLYLQIVQEGIRTGYWSEGRISYFIIDKEYFWGTPVWAYF